MKQVRTRMQPDVPIDVQDDEYEVLLAGGLLAADPAPAPTKTSPAAQPSAAQSTTTSAPAPAADTTTKKG